MKLKVKAGLANLSIKRVMWIQLRSIAEHITCKTHTLRRCPRNITHKPFSDALHCALLECLFSVSSPLWRNSIAYTHSEGARERYTKLLFYRIGAIYARLVPDVIPFALFQVVNLARPSPSHEKWRSAQCANKCAPLKVCFISNDIIDVLIASIEAPYNWNGKLTLVKNSTKTF